MEQEVKRFRYIIGNQTTPEKEPPIIWPSKKTILEVHAKTGKAMKVEIHHRLSEIQQKSEATRDSMGKSIAMTLAKSSELAVSENPDDRKIDTMIGVFFAALKEWANGAEITEDDAYALLDDNVNCATILHRLPDGSVEFGHTEEVSFVPMPSDTLIKYQGDTDKQFLLTFLIPYLPPGAGGFTFSRTEKPFFVSSNGLYTDANPANGLMVNLVSWVMSYLGPQIDPAYIMEKLMPLYDGYGFNVVYPDNEKQVIAYRLEVIHNKLNKIPLAAKPDSVLVGTNAVSSLSPEVKRMEEYVSGDTLAATEIDRLNKIKKRNEHRYSAGEHALRLINQSRNILVGMKPLSALFSLNIFNNRIKRKDHPTVNATITGRVTPQNGFEVKLMCGPVLRKGLQEPEWTLEMTDRNSTLPE